MAAGSSASSISDAEMLPGRDGLQRSNLRVILCIPVIDQAYLQLELAAAGLDAAGVRAHSFRSGGTAERTD